MERTRIDIASVGPVDRWRDEPGLETLVYAVREAWMDYVAGSAMFEIPRNDELLLVPLFVEGDGTLF